MTSLRDNQISAILRMLHLNSDVPEDNIDNTATADDVWKVLVYDQACRDIISPLLKVGTLRKNGVTLHMLIKADRQQIPDVPAIYFLSPTQENVEVVCKDLSKRLYDVVHLNFASQLPRQLLEEVAASCVKSDSVSLVGKIYDQYLSFVTLEPNLFSLNQKESYVAMNDHSISDIQAKANVENVVQGLFSVFVTMGTVPIIRCPKGGAAEMIASELDARFRNSLLSKHNLFAAQSTSTSSFQRPVLVLLDRNIDLTVPLLHTWTYQALIHDLFGLSLNRVTVNVDKGDGVAVEGEARSVSAPRTYDMDSSTDVFWKENAGTSFERIHEEVEAYLQRYREDLEEVNRKTGMGIGDDASPEELANTQGLASAISALPEITERKRMIDQHTNIAIALMKEITSRKIDEFNRIEEDLVTRTNMDKTSTSVLQLITGDDGTANDKMRLFLIYYLCADKVSAGEMEQFKELMADSGVGMECLNYLQKWKSFNQHLSRTLALANDANSTSSASVALSKIVGKVKESVKSFVVGHRDLPVTGIVDAVMEMKNNETVEKYAYFDPKVVQFFTHFPIHCVSWHIYTCVLTMFKK